MPRSRLSAFITRCPIDPAMHAMTDTASAWANLNGVMKENSAPTRLATTMPMPQLVQLKLRLTLGAKGARWVRREMRCCTSTEVCTTNTRKNTRKALLPS
ncbi:Uncharacterised protein [Mycobacterium tuberculosis]|nr:Uncharacterised protein [Mycobacterium tuberculosis]